MAKFITLDGEYGFWVKNSLFDVWLALLALHVECKEQIDSVEAKTAHKWLFAARHGLADFCIPIEALFFTEDADLQIVRKAVASLRDTLGRLPDPFSTDAFALLGFDGDWASGSASKRQWVGLTAAFADLLDGKISATVGDRIDVVGEYASCSTGASKVVN